MINNRPSVIAFKPKNKVTGRNVDDYILKDGEEYFVLEVSPDSKAFIVKNGAGILVKVSALDAEIVK